MVHKTIRAAPISTVRNELAAYGAGLDEKLEIVALNKCDALAPDVLEERTAALEKACGNAPLRISAVSGQGVDDALYRITTAIARASEEAHADDKQVAWQP